jgi:acetyl esterase/lipase
MSSTQNPVLDLWPGGPPDGWARTDKEATEHDAQNNFGIVRNVSHPTLQVFPAAHPMAHAPTVIVCPGGGYYVEAIEHEGYEIAKRLNRDGINAAVLKYRLPNRDVDKPLHKAPLQDAQRAIRLLRSKAASFGMDPERVGILGFSAGGHLAAETSTAPAATYEAIDPADTLSPKPAFTILIYPAYLDAAGQPQLPPDVQVKVDTPPAFLVQAQDDHAYVASSFAYALACQRANVPAELHIYPKGGHGYGIRSKEPGLSSWIEQLVVWLKRPAGPGL